MYHEYVKLTYAGNQISKALFVYHSSSNLVKATCSFKRRFRPGNELRRREISIVLLSRLSRVSAVNLFGYFQGEKGTNLDCIPKYAICRIPASVDVVPNQTFLRFSSSGKFRTMYICEVAIPYFLCDDPDYHERLQGQE